MGERKKKERKSRRKWKGRGKKLGRKGKDIRKGTYGFTSKREESEENERERMPSKCLKE